MPSASAEKGASPGELYSGTPAFENRRRSVPGGRSGCLVKLAASASFIGPERLACLAAAATLVLTNATDFAWRSAIAESKARLCRKPPANTRTAQTTDRPIRIFQL